MMKEIINNPTLVFAKKHFLETTRIEKYATTVTGKYRGAAHSYCNLRTRVEPYKTDYPGVLSQFARIRFSTHHAGYKRDETKVTMYHKQHGKVLFFSLGQLRFFRQLTIFKRSAQ